MHTLRAIEVWSIWTTSLEELLKVMDVLGIIESHVHVQARLIMILHIFLLRFVQWCAN
jgi:hypothetical protein